MSRQETTNNTQDRRLTTGAGDIIGLNDSPVSVGAGGSLSITSANADVARSALQAAERVGAGALSAAQNLTAASNTVASQVADSQRAFVETASGQKTAVYVTIAAVIGAILMARNGAKKAA